MILSGSRLSEQFKVNSFATSDIGLVRKNNEDVFRAMHKEQFFILADGMGGHRSGEVAAAKAVEYMCLAIRNLFLQSKNSLKLESVSSHMRALIENTNLWVHHLSYTDPILKGMGTTLASVLFINQNIVYSHVGDSRIYRFRKNTLTRLTKDHSYDRKIPWMQEGAFSESTNQVSSLRKRVLSQAIGTSIAIKPDVEIQDAKEGDIYLLCSDGLSDVVSDKEISEIIESRSSLQEKGKELVAKAKSGGGHDNITLLLLSVDS